VVQIAPGTASRRGAGGDREEAAVAKGKGEGEEEEGAAKSDAMGGRLIPSAPGGSLWLPPPPAVGGSSNQARPRQVSGRQTLQPPATSSSRGPSDLGSQSWDTQQRGGEPGFPRLSLTLKEVRAGRCKAIGSLLPGRAEFGVLENPLLGESPRPGPWERAGLRRTK
jgi:hypothetical protein